MNTLLEFSFVDYNELPDPLVLEAIAHVCEFEEIHQSYMISIVSKSFYKKTITYQIKILDLDSAT